MYIIVVSAKLHLRKPPGHIGPGRLLRIAARLGRDCSVIRHSFDIPVAIHLIFKYRVHRATYTVAAIHAGPIVVVHRAIFNECSIVVGTAKHEFIVVVAYAKTPKITSANAFHATVEISAFIGRIENTTIAGQPQVSIGVSIDVVNICMDIIGFVWMTPFSRAGKRVTSVARHP